MAKGISVSVASDTREFAAGVKSGMVEPLTTAEDTLAKLAAAGDHAGSQLEATFKDQQGATQRLQGDIDQLNVHIREGSQRSSKAMQSSMHEATQRTEEGMAEAKNAAQQNAIQTAASFDGSFNSIAGGVQGLVSEFAVGFGPAGVLAGTVAAAGIGLVTQAIDGAQTATDAEKAAVQALGTELIDAGVKGKRSFDGVHSALEAMATSVDGSDVTITLQKAWDDARSAGADYQSIVESIATADPVAIGKAQAAVDRLKAAHDAAGRAAQAGGRGTTQALSRQIAATDDLHTALRKAGDQARAAARAQDLAAAAGISKFQQKADLIGQLHDAYAGAAGEASKYQDKESGILNVDKYVKAMERRRKALELYQKALSESSLSDQAKSYIESLGESDAATYMAGYAKASPKQQAQLDAIWSAAGKSNAHTYKEAIGANLDDVIAAPKIARPVVPAPDMSAVEQYIRNPRVVPVIVEGVTRAGVKLF